jgi:hypothetical protein
MKKTRKKPGVLERIAEKILLVLFLLFYCPLWLAIFLLRFPFLWLGKVADALDDLERGLTRSVSTFSRAVAALTPECEWKHQYEQLKKRTEKEANNDRD